MNKRLSRSASIFGVEGLEARRLLSGGVPDFNFGTDGRIVRTNEYAQLGGVIELSDGDYLVGGATYGLNAQGADSVAFLERFNPDGSLDTAFGTNGRLLITGGNEDTTIHGIIELPGGKLLLRTRMSDGPLQLLRINADGSVDGTFGFGGFGEYGRGAVALQSDGKILVIENNIVRRLTEDGLLDTTFGTNGSVILWEQFVWDSSYATSHNVLIDSNDRIIISADAQVTENFSTTYRAGLARLGVNGAIDTAWGDDGFAFVNYGGDEFFNTTDLVRSAAGDYYLLINQDDGEHLIVKFDGDGVLDSSYGNEINRDGAWLLQVDRYGNTGELTSLIFQPDGKLLVRGSGARQDGIILPLTLRLNTDGTRDLTWGTAGDGRVFGDVAGAFGTSLITSDGMLLTVGSRVIDVPTGYDDGSTAPMPQAVLTRYQLTTQVQPIMSVSAGGTLTFMGTSAADTMNTTREGANNGIIVLTRNGTSIDVADSGVRRVWIDAEDGNDVITNSLSLAPTILGGAGHDTIQTSAPAYIEGQAGNDTIYGSAGYDYIVGGDGDDSLVGNDGNDRIFGGAGDDVIEGGNGDDYLYGDAGNDTISGGNGRDRIWGGDGNDLLAGNGGNDILHGEAGNDTLAGLAGNDRLYAGSGNNALYGHGGNDFFFAQNGLADSLFGGSGTDTAEIDDGLDVLASIEVIL